MMPVRVDVVGDDVRQLCNAIVDVDGWNGWQSARSEVGEDPRAVKEADKLSQVFVCE